MRSALTSFIEIGLWIDNVIYSGIGLVYELLIKIANYEIFSQETIGEFSTRIYALLGIFMLFKLTFSLITYVVNPDDMADKSKGMAHIGKNVIISLILILLVPYIFAEAYNLQNIILREHTLENIVFGNQNSNTDIDSAGKIIQYNLFSQFVKPNYDDIESISDCRVIYYDEDGKGTYDMATDPESGEKSLTTYMLNPDCFGENNEGGPLEQLFKDADGEVYFENYKAALADQNYRLLVNNPEVYTLKVEVRENGKAVKYSVINYQFLLSTAIGVVVLLILINFCMDIAVRSIKLAFYQIIAPIPIISLCDPKSSKSGMFSKWVKACFTTYLGLFIRLVALYLAVFIITAVVRDTEFKGVATIFIIIGALIFAKELPKIITDITGIKMDGKFTLNPFKKFENEALGGQRFSGAVGGMVAGAVGGGRGFFGRLGGAFTGAARGFADGKGYESGLAKQADVNRKLRDARINGAGFFGARLAASASRYGLDDFDLENRARTYERNKSTFDTISRNVEQEKNGRLVRKKEIQKNMSDRNRTKSSFDRFSSSAKAMETRAIEQIKIGAAGDLSEKYGAKQAYYDKLKQNNGTAIIGANGDIITLEQINSKYGGYDIDTNGNLFVKSAIEGASPVNIGKVINDAHVSKAWNDAENYLNEVAKYDYMSRTIANFKGETTYMSVEGDVRDATAASYDDKTFTSSYKNYEEALNNLGEVTTFETDEGFTRGAVTTGKEIHKQFGQSKGVINAIDRSLYADNDKITEIDNEITRIESETRTGISGFAFDEATGTFVMKDNLTYEEAAKYLDREDKEIKHIKDTRKANRDAAAASKINWNGK